jgi:hypothetical protein
MRKSKVFAVPHAAYLEHELSAWLAANPNIKIESVTQTTSGPSLGVPHGELVVVIIYSESAA